MLEKTELNPDVKISLQIYQIIRKAIICCQLPQGYLLSEKEIADHFHVSRQPVREAFIKLAEAGLLQILPQRGSRVTHIQPQQVIDAQFIREAIELAIIKRATEEVTEAHLLRLETNLKEQELAIKNNDALKFLEKDDQFHQLLVDIIDCPLAWNIIENIKAMMDRVRFITLQHITPPQLMLAQHKTIYAALQARDQAQATLGMQHHLRTILSSMQSVFSEHPDCFR